MGQSRLVVNGQTAAGKWSPLAAAKIPRWASSALRADFEEVNTRIDGLLQQRKEIAEARRRAAAAVEGDLREVDGADLVAAAESVKDGTVRCLQEELGVRRNLASLYRRAAEELTRAKQAAKADLEAATEKAKADLASGPFAALAKVEHPELKFHLRQVLQFHRDVLAAAVAFEKLRGTPGHGSASSNTENMQLNAKELRGVEICLREMLHRIAGSVAVAPSGGDGIGGGRL